MFEFAWIFWILVTLLFTESWVRAWIERRDAGESRRNACEAC